MSTLYAVRMAEAFYSSRQWKEVVPKVWKRDRANCQRCGVHKGDYGGSIHIHHVVSFAVEALRSELPNLVLLCEECHRWVHSNENINQDLIRDAHAVVA